MSQDAKGDKSDKTIRMSETGVEDYELTTSDSRSHITLKKMYAR